MFRGTSYHTIDSKGRIIVPTRFRAMAQTDGYYGLMVSRLDGGLVAYNRDEWRRIEQKIISKDVRTEAMRRFRRLFIGNLADCPCDAQHRILITPPLREYAGLDKEIVLVGVLDHFEIWSRERWDLENEALEEDLKTEALRLEISELGL